MIISLKCTHTINERWKGKGKKFKMEKNPQRKVKERIEKRKKSKEMKRKNLKNN